MAALTRLELIKERAAVAARKKAEHEQRRAAAVARMRDNERERRRTKAAAKVEAARELTTARERWETERAEVKRLAIEKGEKRLGDQFGGKDRETRRKESSQTAAAEGWGKRWRRESICRIFGGARVRQFVTIDGEWTPPNDIELEVDSKGKAKRTYSEPIKQRVFGAFDGYEYRHYPDLGKLLRGEVRPSTSGTWFYAHSGGKADFLFFLEELERRFAPRSEPWILEKMAGDDAADAVADAETVVGSGAKKKWDLRGAMAGSRMLFVILRHGRMRPKKDSEGRRMYDENDVPLFEFHAKNVWTFVDSFSTFPMALADVGKSLTKPAEKWIEKTFGKKDGLTALTDDERARFDERAPKEIKESARLAKGEAPETSRWLQQRFGIGSFEGLGEKERKTFYRDAPVEVLTDYNARDCEILWRGIDSYETLLLGLGGYLQKTGAASALSLFRRAFLDSDIRTDERINSYVRQSYIASRVEKYRSRLTNGFMMDINSSFAASMLRELPAEVVAEDKRLPDVGKKGAVYAAELTVSVPEMYIPPLPLRTTWPVKGIFFPTGTWRGWFTTPDVELLVEAGGRVLDVHRVFHFRPFTELRDYAQTIYGLREEATRTNDPAERWLKLLLVALYGKFGERDRRAELIFNPDFTTLDKYLNGEIINDYDDDGNIVSEQFGGMQPIVGNLWEREHRQRPAHRHVILSSFITADARARLTRFNWQEEKIGGRATYSDTDAVCGTKKLPTGTKLGELKPEALIEEAEFHAPKVYTYRGFKAGQNWEQGAPITKTKAKGFSRVGDDDWKLLMQGKPIRQQRMASMRETAEYIATRARPEGMSSKARREWESQRSRGKFERTWINPSDDVARILADEDEEVAAMVEHGEYSPREVAFEKRQREPELPKRRPLEHGETAPWSVEELVAMGVTGIKAA